MPRPVSPHWLDFPESCNGRVPVLPKSPKLDVVDHQACGSTNEENTERDKKVPRGDFALRTTKFKALVLRRILRLPSEFYEVEVGSADLLSANP
jgi:hypothetical protein